MKASKSLPIAWAVLIVGALLAALLARAADSTAAAPAVPYPEGYREWAHVKTGLIGAEHKNFAASGGYHHIYANAKALEGYRTGKFPDGAIIVFDRMEAVPADGAFTEGTRYNVDLMVKDSVGYAATGGWGFERFKGDSHTERVVAARAAKACYECHTRRAENDYVFSSYRK